MKKAKCEPVTQKLARCLPILKIAECQNHVSESQPTSSGRPRPLLRAVSAPCLRVNDETRPRTRMTKSTVFNSIHGKITNRRTQNCFKRCKRFLPSFRSSYESSCAGLQFITSNYMATTLTCPSKSSSRQCTLPCSRCGNPCSCYCLPPPCNTVPKCIQYMTSYHCPRDFWFPGAYHVMGCCYPYSPYSGPCAACCSNPGRSCSSKYPCACFVPSMNCDAAISTIVPKITLSELGRKMIKKCEVKASSLNPGSVLNDSLAALTIPLSKLIFCTSVENSIKAYPPPVPRGFKPESVADVITKPKSVNRTIKEEVLDVFELGNLYATGILEKCPAAFNKSSEPGDLTQLSKLNLDPSMSTLISTCALYDPFVALCTGAGLCPPQPPKESNAVKSQSKVPSNSCPACGCCCSCGPCGCLPCGCGPCGCGPCGCGPCSCSPCGTCAGPCPAYLGFNCGPNCGPQGCNPCLCGCGPCGSGSCGCAPCCCASCGCGPCGCGPCGGCCGSCSPCGPCGPCGCGPCFPPCLPCPINPGDQSSGPLAAGASLRFPTKCCGIFTGDMNLGVNRVQIPMDSQCQKDPNNSDSICFCESCRANRTQTYASSQHKTNEDCHAKLETNTISSSKASKPSKVTIDPKLAKEYPFSKIPPKHTERFC